MIVAVCSDGGSPGVTTLALMLAWHWQASVVEADPSGGDLRFRVRPAETGRRQEFLDDRPGLVDLAVAARTATPLPSEVGPVLRLASDIVLPRPPEQPMAGGVKQFTQATSLGVRVVAGPAQAEEFTALAGLWPSIAVRLAAARDVVVVDLGRLQPGHPAWPIAAAAQVIVVLAWPTVEGLHHLRARVDQLAGALGEGHERSPVAVAMVADDGGGDPVGDARVLLGTLGLSVEVLGAVAVDPAAVHRLRGGTLTGRLTRSRLFRSTAQIADTLAAQWPVVNTALRQPTSAPVTGRARAGR